MANRIHSKNMYSVLYTNGETKEPEDKKVQFAKEVCVSEDDSLRQEPVKTWDGASPVSILYAKILYNFLNAPRSVPLSVRNKTIADELKGTGWLIEFIDEAMNTCSKLENPESSKVPFWSKGSVGKNGQWNLNARDNSSLTWMKLFVKALEKA